MSPTPLRILRTFVAAAVVGVGAGIMFAAATEEHTRLSAPAFGLGVAIVLAALPITPWLLVLPTLFHRPYWGRIGSVEGDERTRQHR